MSRKRRAFSLEFKSEAVRRLGERRLAGVTLVQVGRDLGVRPDMLRRWAKQYGGKSRAEVIAAADLEAENRRLRREVDLLRQERDFAKKAAAYFAKELR
jgi:transposase